MENEVLNMLAQAFAALQFKEPFDGRETLAKNPNGGKWKKRDGAGLKGLVWHQELGWGSVEAVARYHTGPDSHLCEGGVESISYTWAIRRDGQLVLCNDFDRAVWSQGYQGRPGDENAEFMSVMYEGLFHGAHVTDNSAGEPNYRQMLAGLILWHICRDNWGWDDDDLYGHYHFGKPACPGTTLEKMIEAARVNVEKAKFDLSTVQGRQEALKGLGYSPGTPDGIWGPASKGALVKFQAAHGLDADGVWGKNSEAAIAKALKDI